MNQDERADYEQQQDEERRSREEERDRYRAEHPLWDRCRNHPERAALDPSTCDKQWCAECIETMQRAYADYQTAKERAAGGFYAYRADTTGWLYGAGERPTYSKTEDRK